MELSGGQRSADLDWLLLHCKIYFTSGFIAVSDYAFEITAIIIP